MNTHSPHSANPCSFKQKKHPAHALNQGCFCISLDEVALENALHDHLKDGSLYQLVQVKCPHIFSAQPVFISATHAKRIQEVIQTIEHVIALPAFQELVLASAPPIAQHPAQGAAGIFYGYDFHVSEEGFGLIEINTNAGGAMMNSILAKAQRACCEPTEKIIPVQKHAEQFEKAIVAMFQNEWALSARNKPLKCIAIVDEHPEQQYLYPEFILFKRLLEAHGIRTLIADPHDFSYTNGALLCQGEQVDFIYNRLTDFYLEEPASAAMKAAYLDDAIVLSPHPRAHALYADKHHLALLSNKDFLNSLDIDEAQQQILLSSIPYTERITANNVERLWKERRHFFFKPTKGFGSKAAYRGDKITTKVWTEIIQNDYIAQRIVHAGERGVSDSEQERKLKFDLRAYTYLGKVQWMTARLYQGQTTNFRTQGGGFAVVYESEET